MFIELAWFYHMAQYENLEIFMKLSLYYLSFGRFLWKIPNLKKSILLKTNTIHPTAAADASQDCQIIKSNSYFSTYLTMKPAYPLQLLGPYCNVSRRVKFLSYEYVCGVTVFGLESGTKPWLNIGNRPN